MHEVIHIGIGDCKIYEQNEEKTELIDSPQMYVTYSELLMQT